MSENLTQQLPDDPLRLILAGLESLGARMAALEERVDRRLQETRPIWEQVLARLDGIEGRMDSLESRMGNVETRMNSLEEEFQSGIRRLQEMVNVLNEDVFEVRAGQKVLGKRLTKVESESAR
ncbi:MAG: hypothetical protein LC800_08445 [Acidobacteria bacterium]|nr:hypothetical protein [Acidobacteriota bacterium]